MHTPTYEHFLWRHHIRHDHFIKSLHHHIAPPLLVSVSFLCSSVCHRSTAAHFLKGRYIHIFVGSIKAKAAAVRVCVNVWGGKQQFGAASASVCAEWPGALRGAETWMEMTLSVVLKYAGKWSPSRIGRYMLYFAKRSTNHSQKK